MIKKAIVFAAVILLVLLLIVWVGLPRLFSLSVADYDGVEHLEAITHPVEISFDNKGIPQVWAESEPDLYFSLGWLHAAERLFQMELARRMSQGTMAELLGEDMLDIDLYQRKIGFYRKAMSDVRTMDDELALILNSYCSGINRWIENTTLLPPEFLLLRSKPADFKPVDIYCLSYYQTWFSHLLMDYDRQYQYLSNKLGKGIIPHLKKYFDWSPPTIYDRSFYVSSNSAWLQHPMGYASNSFTLAPERSVSGQALHAADPHLYINTIPNFWYIAALHLKDKYDVIGITLPGLPFVLMGHNRNIAYSFTVAAVDIIDYYRYDKSPQDSSTILTPGGYRPLTVIPDTIYVKGKRLPVIQHIRMTPLGPIVKEDAASATAIHWAGFDFDLTETLHAALDLCKSTHFDQFRRNVTQMGALNVNWIYSDRSGNTGYQLGSPIPIRTYENTFNVLSGEDSSFYWQGYYSLDKTPFMQNPAGGWIASCNNQIVSPQWSYDLPGFYSPYRIIRAGEMLTAKPLNTTQDLHHMQMDKLSVRAQRWKPLLLKTAAHLDKIDLHNELNAWDGAMLTDEKPALIFRFWWYLLPWAVFYDELGSGWRAGSALLEALYDPKMEKYIDNTNTPDHRENLLQISGIALDSALVLAANRSYGQASQLYFRHPLSRNKVLDMWLDLNRGPYVMGGGPSSLCANYNLYSTEEQLFKTSVGASMRFLLDWSDLNSFQILTNFGQSGNPFSPHYDDFFELWHQGRQWTVPVDKKPVFKSAKSILKLLPADFP